MRIPLSDGVHMAVCDEDVVVLDTRRDLYSCLPEASPYLSVGDGWVDGPEALLADLAAAGLLDPDAVAHRRPIPPRPIRALPLPAGRARLVEEIDFWRTALDAWRLGPSRRSLPALLADQASAPFKAQNLARVARLTAVFVRRLPWDPAQGACLYRAWLLRRLLRRAGQEATWVFAVKTWPFGAHCWLQVGDVVLDDDPDRLAAYTPILAV